MNNAERKAFFIEVLEDKFKEFIKMLKNNPSEENHKESIEQLKEVTKWGSSLIGFDNSEELPID